MSIEALLQAHVEAIKENTAAVLLLESTLVGRAGKSPKETAVHVTVEGDPDGDKLQKAIKATAPSDKTAKAIMQAEDIKQEIEPDSAEQATPTNVTYETVRNLVLKLAGGGKREEIKAINAKHGIVNLKVLLDKEDDFSTVNDQAKLGAVYAELQALEG